MLTPDTTVFFGAGVGVPAGLPTAVTLISEVTERLVSEQRWTRRVLELVAPFGPLRFETAMEWLSEVCDPHLDVLGFLDGASPGSQHVALAAAGELGVRLLTVNFDDLVEQAVRERGGIAVTFDPHSRTRPRAGSGTVEVVKLHGTRRVHSRRGVRNNRRAVHATIREIVRGGGGTGLISKVRGLVREAVDGRDLIVAGYSGSDDLDVMPTLALTRPATVVWISHTNGAPRDARPTTALPDAVRSLLLAWEAAGARVRLVVGETDKALADLGFVVPASSTTSKKSQTEQRARHRYLDAWAKRAHEHDPTGLAWAAMLLGELALLDEAHAALLAAKPARRRDALWSPQRRYFELAQNVYLRSPDEVSEVRRWARRAVVAAAARNDEITAADADIIVARSLLYRGQAAVAERRLNSAAEHLRLAGDVAKPPHPVGASLIHCRARLAVQRYDTERAVELALEAARQRHRLGHWSEECESLQVAAQGRWMDAEYTSASRLLNRAEHIARTGPYPDQLQATLSRAAMAAYDAADVDRAYGAGKEAAKLGAEVNLAEWHQALLAYGQAASELSLFEDALAAFEKMARLLRGQRVQSLLISDCHLGLADALVHLGRATEIDESALVSWVETPWDQAHAAAIVRHKGGPADAVEHAIERAWRLNPDPPARAAIGILRLGRTGPQFDRLAAYATDVLRAREQARRRELLRPWLHGMRELRPTARVSQRR